MNSNFIGCSRGRQKICVGRGNLELHWYKNVRAGFKPAPTCDLCTAITQILRSSRKFCVDLECSNTGIDSRQGAKYPKFRNRKIDNFYKPSYSFFPTFAALASLREIFRVSVAALPRWVLCG